MYEIHYDIYHWPAAYTVKKDQSQNLACQSLLQGKCSQKYWAAARPDTAVRTGSNTSASCSHSSTKRGQNKKMNTLNQSHLKLGICHSYACTIKNYVILTVKDCKIIR